MGQFSFDKRLFMIANELNRANHAFDDPVEFRNSMERALEICDYFIESIAQSRGNIIREALRLRQLIARHYQNPPQSTLALQKILLQLNPTAWRQVAESFDGNSVEVEVNTDSHG